MRTSQSNNTPARTPQDNVPLEPYRQTSTSDSLPPDVEAARKTRTNNDLLYFFQRPKQPGATTAGSVKGIGLYTHVEDPTQMPLFPHQRYIATEKQLKFLPLGGPHRTPRRRGAKGDLPDDVKATYDSLREAMMEEEFQQRGAPYNPRVKFGALYHPTSVAPPVLAPFPSVDTTKHLAWRTRPLPSNDKSPLEESKVDFDRNAGRLSSSRERKDVVMGGTEVDSAQATTPTAPPTNMNDPARQSTYNVSW